ITGLSDKNITIKALKQSFYDENDFAYLDVKIKGLDLYRRIHGEIAFEKAIKTLGAIITSTIDKNDFVGHLSEDEMLLIVNPIIGEKTASFLTFAFDNILNKFYSEKEFENNFTLQTAEEIKENKEGLMRLNIALVEKSTKKSPTDILNTLHELLNLLTNSTNSTYIVDRAKLKGETLNLNKNKVLIYEPDYALSLLLENVCIMNKIEVTTVFDYFEFAKKYQSINPNLVILDFSAKNSLEIAKTISKNSTKLIFSSSSLNKKEILKSGADLYMPKPYDIEDMIHSIKKFLN
ncbi:response regulator, partial [bacterium]|nr:response regulator [bacterium]